MTFFHNSAHLDPTDAQLRNEAIKVQLNELNQKAGKYAPKREARFARSWYIGFWVFFISLLIVSCYLGVLIFRPVEKGKVEVSFPAGTFLDKTYISVAKSNELKNSDNWERSKEVRNNQPSIVPNIVRKVTDTQPATLTDTRPGATADTQPAVATDTQPATLADTQDSEGDEVPFINYRVLIWSEKGGAPTLLYLSPEFSLYNFETLEDVSNTLFSQFQHPEIEIGEIETAIERRIKNDNRKLTGAGIEKKPEPSRNKTYVSSISVRPENEWHFLVAVAIGTLLVFLARFCYAWASQVRHTPNIPIAISEAVFYCIFVLSVPADYDLGLLIPKLPGIISKILNAGFFKITSVGLIGVFFMTFAAEAVKALWGRVSNHVNRKNDSGEGFSSYRLSLLYHCRFQRRKLFRPDRYTFVVNSLAPRIAVWILIAVAAVITLIIEKKGSPMFEVALYICAFGAASGLFGFALHLTAPQASLLRAEYHYLRLRKSDQFFHRYPSAIDDYFQVLANLFIGSTPIKSEERKYLNLNICTNALERRLGRVQIAANLINAYDDTIEIFFPDRAKQRTNSEYAIASRIYDILVAKPPREICFNAHVMIQTAFRCMFEEENVKENWQDLLSGSTVTLEQLRAIAMAEFLRRVNESHFLISDNSCPLHWKCKGDCNLLNTPARQKARFRIRYLWPRWCIASICRKKDYRAIQESLLKDADKKLLQDMLKEHPENNTNRAALLIEFPYILAQSIHKRFDMEMPLISSDELRMIVENYFYNLFANTLSGSQLKGFYRFNKEACEQISADVERFFDCAGKDTPWDANGKYLDRILPERDDLKDDCIEIDFPVDSDKQQFLPDYGQNLDTHGWPSLRDKSDKDRKEALLRLTIQFWADTRFKKLAQILFLPLD